MRTREFFVLSYGDRDDLEAVNDYEIGDFDLTVFWHGKKFDASIPTEVGAIHSLRAAASRQFAEVDVSAQLRETATAPAPRRRLSRPTPTTPRAGW